MNNLSLKSLVTCVAIMCYSAFSFYPKWEQYRTESTLSWDVSGYYMYLPALFIYKDIKQCKFIDDVLKNYGPTPEIQQFFKHEKSGNVVMKYAAGQAVVMSPFFFIGHTVASASDKYPDDGFSYPYQISLGIGMFLYSLLGIFLMRKALLHFFDDKVTAIVLFAIVFGTNYLNYSSIDQCQTHSPLFTIYAALLLVTINFYRKPNYKKAILIGALTGIATLIRPTDIISILIPLFWNVTSVNTFKERIQYIFSNLKLYSIAIIVFILIAIIQPLYWKYVGNEWLIYSYQDQGFSWLNPHWHDYTFSFYSGWLTYCPMMILPFLGFYFLYKRKTNFLLITGFSFLAYYIVIAWDVWDYGGISGRAMIQYYPILALAFASLVEWINKSKIAMFIFYPIFLFFTYINIWWTYNAHRVGVPVIGLSKPLYYRVIGRWSIEEDDLKLYDNKYSFNGEMKEKMIIYQNDFETDTTNVMTPEGINGKGLFIDKGIEYTPEINIRNEGQFKNWMRMYVDVKSFQKEWNNWSQPLMVYKFYRSDEIVLSGSLKFHRFLVDNQTRNLYLDAKIPKDNWDRVGIFFWNPGSDKRVVMDNLRVDTFND